MSKSYRNLRRDKYVDGSALKQVKPKGEQKRKSEARRQERALKTKNVDILLEDEEYLDDDAVYGDDY